MSKEKSWFEQNGWYWDKRDHMWKKVSGEKMVEVNNPMSSVSGMKTKTNSKPFTKQYNILIFDNCQYPIKFHEVMWKT